MNAVDNPRPLEPERLVTEVLDRLGPERTIPEGLQAVPRELWDGGVRLAGLGKAAVEQVAVALRWFDARQIPVAGALAVTKHDHGAGDHRFRVLRASHPVCDESSRTAAAELRRFAAETPDGLPVALCLSGGGSALAAEPRPPFTFAQKTEAFRQLLEGGASIEDTNLLRRELSAFKNGGLRLACGTRPVVTLITSDVPLAGDRLEDLAVVASGPTIHVPLDREAIRATARRWLAPELATTVCDGLDTSERAAWNQQLAAARHPADHVEVVADYRLAIARAAEALREQGYRVHTIAAPGNAPVEAGVADHLEELRALDPPRRRVALVSAGEYPSRVVGDGRGGRNTEFVVRLARALFGDHPAGLDDATLDRLTVLSLATDGGDGPTDAAGGWLDRAALQRGRDAGADLDAALADSDTLTFLEACGTALRTGPTATNLMDLHVVVVD